MPGLALMHYNQFMEHMGFNLWIVLVHKGISIQTSEIITQIQNALLITWNQKPSIFHWALTVDHCGDPKWTYKYAWSHFCHTNKHTAFGKLSQCLLKRPNGFVVCTAARLLDIKIEHPDSTGVTTLNAVTSRWIHDWWRGRVSRVTSIPSVEFQAIRTRSGLWLLFWLSM